MASVFALVIPLLALTSDVQAARIHAKMKGDISATDSRIATAIQDMSKKDQNNLAGFDAQKYYQYMRDKRTRRTPDDDAVSEPEVVNGMEEDDPADEFSLGVYDVDMDITVVEQIARDSDELGEVKKGDAIEVLKVKWVASDTRVRAEIRFPHATGDTGWVSLLDTSDDTRWATNREAFCASAYSCTYQWSKCKWDEGEKKCLPLPLATTTTTTTTTTDAESQFGLGIYDLDQETDVTSEMSKDSTDIAKLAQGDVVNVIRIESIASEDRIRAEIEHPHGWISLLDTKEGSRWATNREDFCASLNSILCRVRSRCLVSEEGVCHARPPPVSTTSTTTTTTTATTTTTTSTSHDILAPYKLGIYDIKQPTCVVKETVDRTSKEVATLKEKDVVKVLQVVWVEDAKRVRAEIEEPHGWISLLDPEEDYEWATNRAAFCEPLNWAQCKYHYNRCHWPTESTTCVAHEKPFTTTTTTTTPWSIIVGPVPADDDGDDDDPPPPYPGPASKSTCEIFACSGDLVHKRGEILCGNAEGPACSPTVCCTKSGSVDAVDYVDDTDETDDTGGTSKDKKDKKDTKDTKDTGDTSAEGKATTKTEEGGAQRQAPVCAMAALVPLLYYCIIA